MNVNLTDRMYELGQKAIRIKQLKAQLKQEEKEYDALEQQAAMLQQIENSNLEIKPKEEGNHGVDKV